MKQVEFGLHDPQLPFFLIGSYVQFLLATFCSAPFWALDKNDPDSSLIINGWLHIYRLWFLHQIVLFTVSLYHYFWETPNDQRNIPVENKVDRIAHFFLGLTTGYLFKHLWRLVNYHSLCMRHNDCGIGYFGMIAYFVNLLPTRWRIIGRQVHWLFYYLLFCWIKSFFRQVPQVLEINRVPLYVFDPVLPIVPINPQHQVTSPPSQLHTPEQFRKHNGTQLNKTLPLSEEKSPSIRTFSAQNDQMSLISRSPHTHVSRPSSPPHQMFQGGRNMVSSTLSSSNVRKYNIRGGSASPISSPIPHKNTAEKVFVDEKNYGIQVSQTCSKTTLVPRTLPSTIDETNQPRLQSMNPIRFSSEEYQNSLRDELCKAMGLTKAMRHENSSGYTLLCQHKINQIGRSTDLEENTNGPPPKSSKQCELCVPSIIMSPSTTRHDINSVQSRENAPKRKVVKNLHK